MASSKPNYVPKTPSPNTITLWVRASMYGFGRGTQFSPQCVLSPVLSLKEVALFLDSFFGGLECIGAHS